MKTFLLTAAGASALLFAVPAFTQAAAPAASAPDHRGMKSMTRAEMAQTVQRHFARLDSDRDGFVTRAEAEAAAAQHGQGTRQRGAKRRDPAEKFARLDANRDGQITRAEADAARAALAERIQRKAGNGLFERADANRDGIVSRAEFDAMRAVKRQRVVMGKGMAGQGMARHGMAGGMAKHMFTMADADKDGRVSLAEVTAMSLRHFDTADTNRDGSVTREERRQMHRSMRQTPAG